MKQRAVVLITLFVVLFFRDAQAQYCDCGPKKSAAQVTFETPAGLIQTNSISATGATAQVTRADEQDSLLNGALIGGVLGSAAGIYVFRDWSKFGGNDPGAKETITGVLIGGALGASIGMLIDALF
jgi:hypothetical protein